MSLSLYIYKQAPSSKQFAPFNLLDEVSEWMGHILKIGTSGKRERVHGETWSLPRSFRLQ